ncbi:MAG: hypothetical protein E7632_06000 [Ruminococcaceae bacterium]|nr:hypothetical protein [Oscillospiraceae bacterium]
MTTIKSGRRLIAKIRDYIEECRNADTKKPVFANVAGFCRFAGISVAEFLSLKRRFPGEFENAGAYFEDAALNSGATASLVGMYLREYGFWGNPATEDIICEHDGYEDGI